LSAGASPQTPLGSLQRSTRPPSWILGGLLLRGGKGRVGKGRGGKGREREGRKQGGEGRERGGMGREGAVSAPQAKAWPPRTIFLAPALRRSTCMQPSNFRPLKYPLCIFGCFCQIVWPIGLFYAKMSTNGSRVFG